MYNKIYLEGYKLIFLIFDVNKIFLYLKIQIKTTCDYEIYLECNFWTDVTNEYVIYKKILKEYKNKKYWKKIYFGLLKNKKKQLSNH